MAARRKRERKSTPPESRATRQPRRRPQPCKRCAVSARRRGFSGSFWNSRVEAFDEFLKTRVVAKRVEPLVYLDAAIQALQQNVAFQTKLCSSKRNASSFSPSAR